MKSLDLNRVYYQTCVAEVLATHFPEIASRHAAALIGWGSEVLGNDDELSHKYGWGPRVALFLSQADHALWSDRVSATLHREIPPVFMGHPTRFTDPALGPPQPTDDPNGVLQIPIATCERFTDLYLGLSSGELSRLPLPARRWLLIPEAGLLRLTAGEVYHDGVGRLSELREVFRYFPDDVWRYRLAYQWTRLHWDIDLVGLCAHRGDVLSAGATLGESIKRIIGLVFLLNKTYKPGYRKWIHRQFYRLPLLAAEIGPVLEEAMVATDCMRAVELLYPVLDRLIAFQTHCAELPAVDYQRPTTLDRGFFAYDLQPVIDGIRKSITGELRDLSFKTGALDQWVTDQDLLMGPAQLKSLRGIYDCEDPMKALFERDAMDEFL